MVSAWKPVLLGGLGLAVLGCTDATKPAGMPAGGGEGGEAGQMPVAAGELVVESFECTETLSDVLVFHPVCLDGEQKIVPWNEHATPYADISRRAWEALKGVPNLPNGKPTYYSWAMFAGVPPEVWAPGKGLPHHAAGVLSMFIDSALTWYAYSGDRGVLDDIVVPFADHMLENGMTTSGDAWKDVPYSCSDPNVLTYHGSTRDDGSGDGDGNLQPDKVGEVGLGFLKLYEHTGDQRYLDTALACADALVANVGEGSATVSPWPFRVSAATNELATNALNIAEPYCAHVSASLRLFSELTRLGLGDTDGYQATHDDVLAWALEYPLQNDDWVSYFEDVSAITIKNRNQYAPLELARYLLEHPEVTDDAATNALQMVDFVERQFVQDFTNTDGLGGVIEEPAIQFGAETVSEQDLDTAKMGSHTARFASILALQYELTGDATARERAFRSFNWATYCSSEDGIVNVGPNPREGFWFSDGYGDYIRHFMAGLGSIPEWAPPDENHLVRSSSIVTTVAAEATSVSYATFDEAAEDVLRLESPPARIEVAGTEVSQGNGDDTYDVRHVTTGGVVVRLRRTQGSEVVVTLGD